MTTLFVRRLFVRFRASVEISRCLHHFASPGLTKRASSSEVSPGYNWFVWTMMIRGRASFKPGPCHRLEPNLLLDLCLLGLRRPSIALAETFTTSAIAPLDEAGSQVVATAIAADELLRLRAPCLHLRTSCLNFFSSCSLVDLLGLRARRIRMTTLG